MSQKGVKNTGKLTQHSRFLQQINVLLQVLTFSAFCSVSYTSVFTSTIFTSAFIMSFMMSLMMALVMSCIMTYSEQSGELNNGQQIMLFTWLFESLVDYLCHHHNSFLRVLRRSLLHCSLPHCSLLRHSLLHHNLNLIINRKKNL